MTASLLALAVVLAVPPDGPRYQGQPREPHALAPSLPKLTEKEEEEITRVIDRFIDADTGKVKGAEAAKATAEFRALGAEATFLLIEGLNRAANMEHSCPAVLIAKKLSLIVNSTTDTELLDFARENIGGGVTAKRHQVVLKDLKLACTLRKSAVVRANIAYKAPAGGTGAAKDRTPKTMSVPELVAAADKEKGELLATILTELATRKGDQVALALGKVADGGDKDGAKLAGQLLMEHLSAQPADLLKGWLKNGGVTVKVAAARVIGNKKYLLTNELIAALSDSDDPVRQAARAALVKLTGDAVDHGPELNAGPAERSRAAERWREYFAKKS